MGKRDRQMSSSLCSSLCLCTTNAKFRRGARRRFNAEITENTEKTNERENVLAVFSVASVSSVNSVLKSSSVAARGCAVPLLLVLHNFA